MKKFKAETVVRALLLVQEVRDCLGNALRRKP